MHYVKNIITVLSLIFSLFNNTFIISAQSTEGWEGKWEVIIDETSFCNIHIVMGFMGDKAPMAFIEGMDNGKPFKATCSIQEIPQRNAIVLMEKEDMKGFTYYNAEESLLMMVTQKSGVKLFWGQIALGRNYGLEAPNLEFVKSPKYKGDYALNYQSVPFSLSVSEVNNHQFSAHLTSNTVNLECSCSLQATNLAICYAQNAKGHFFLDFASQGPRIINEKEKEVFSVKLIPSESNTPIVLTSPVE